MTNFAQFTNSSARWCVIALGISIPLSTALDNLLLLALLALVLASNGRAVWLRLMQNPVARASGLLFAALLLGTAYGNTALRDAAGILGKYADLVLVSVLMVAARDAKTRRHAMLGFLAAMLITAVLSWLVGLSILPWAWRDALPDNPAIFRSSITQGILMAYAAYLFILQAHEAPGARTKWLFIAMALLASGNVLFMNKGRTGYLVLLALLAYYAWTTLARLMLRAGRSIGWRESAILSLLGLTLAYGAYQASPRLHDRVDLIVTEYKAWQPNVRNETSTGARLEFYYNTLALIKQHPLFGVGTGGFVAAYALQVQGKNMATAHNPHNEYLLITAQIGVVGLGLLLYLFYTQWTYAGKLTSRQGQDAARAMVLTIGVTCLFNAPLLDHTEGLFFAFMSALLFANSEFEERVGLEAGNE